MSNLYLNLFKVTAVTSFLILNLALYGQSWPNPNATWHYSAFDESGFLQGFVEYQCNGDTSINGVTYQRITRIYEDVNYPPYPFNHVVRSIDPNSLDGKKYTIFTRFSNDTVYRHAFDKEYVFFTFNASVGQTWSGFRSNSLAPCDSACNAKLPLVVNSKSSVTYNGLTLKEMLVEDTLYQHIYSGSVAPGENPKYRIVERLGVMNNFPFASELYTENCQTQSDYGYHYELKKYSDGEFSYQTGIVENNQFKVNLYPNPAAEDLSIDIQFLSLNSQYTITDALGNLVKLGTLSENYKKVDVRSFSNGVYFISISNGILKSTYRSFIVNH